MCEHLGHDPSVHLNSYRDQGGPAQTAKIAKMLIAMENGNFAKLAAKKLSEIDIDGNLVSIL